MFSSLALQSFETETQALDSSFVGNRNEIRGVFGLDQRLCLNKTPKLKRLYEVKTGDIVVHFITIEEVTDQRLFVKLSRSKSRIWAKLETVGIEGWLFAQPDPTKCRVPRV